MSSADKVQSSSTALKCRQRALCPGQAIPGGGRHKPPDEKQRRECLVWTYVILGLAGAANVAGLVAAQTPPFKCLSMFGIVAAAVAAMLVHHRRRR